MPNRLVPMLGLFCGALGALYLCLMVATIAFAAWQTQNAGAMRDAEAAIGTLEAQYYQEVNRINATDPATLGFVAPKNIAYVTAASAPALTFAGGQ